MKSASQHDHLSQQDSNEHQTHRAQDTVATASVLRRTRCPPTLGAATRSPDASTTETPSSHYANPVNTLLARMLQFFRAIRLASTTPISPNERLKTPSSEVTL